jgi:putative PEP-CTERM system TPR-repeat lipoprotein
LAALTLAVGAGCVQPSDPTSLIASANAYRQKGEFRAAIIELRNVLQQNPDHAEARFLLGKTYLETSETAFATVELRKAEALGYDPKQLVPELAKSLFLQDKFNEALDATDPAKVASVQGSPEILNVRAWAQLGMRQMAAAKESLNLALTLRPDFSDGILTQARIALAEGISRGRCARRPCTPVRAEESGWVVTQGHAAASVRRAGAGASLLPKGHRINPYSVVARLDLASLEIETGRFDEAAQELEAAREIAPRNVMVVYLQALLALRSGNSKAALDLVYRALEIAPKHVPSTLLGASPNSPSGIPNRPEVFLQAAVSLSPDNAYARKVLATSQIKNRQFAQAAATLEPVVDQGIGVVRSGSLGACGRSIHAEQAVREGDTVFRASGRTRPAECIDSTFPRMSRMATAKPIARSRISRPRRRLTQAEPGPTSCGDVEPQAQGV